MTMQEELEALHRMIPLDEDEELIEALEGSVTGPGMDARLGIMFVTTRRVGISAAAGFFTTDECYWCDLPLVMATWTENTKLHIKGPETISIQHENNEALKEFVGIVQTLQNRYVRADLEDIWQGVRSAFKAERWSEARDGARSILAKQSGCIPALFHLALCSENLDDSATAIETFRQLLDLNPPSDMALDFRLDLARLYAFSSEPAQALEYASYVIDVTDAAQAYKWRGIARYWLEDNQSALTDIRRCLELEPTDNRAWYWLGVLARKTKDLSALKSAVDQMRQLGADDEAIEFEPALLLQQQKYAEAFEKAAEAIAAGREAAEVVEVLLESAPRANPEKAIAFIPKLDETYRGGPRYEELVAILYASLRRGSEAWERIRHVELPDTPAAHALKALFRTLSLLEARDYSAAADNVLKVLSESDPGYVPAWVGDEEDREFCLALAQLAGWALLELGEAKRALGFLQHAESSGNAFLPWLRDALPELLERANAAAARNASMAPVAGASAYEILHRFTQALKESGRLDTLAERADKERQGFDDPPIVAVMGEYSVGKSSFINALLRNPLLPTGEGVTTGTITVLRHGEDERMRAVFDNGRVIERAGLSSVTQFVKETGAGTTADDLPHHVDVFLRHDVLKRVRIVDTPGLNAPFKKHREITEQYLDEADAIVWLFNVENAGKIQEKKFLDKVALHKRKTVGVVNQIDLVPPDEAADAIDYVKESFTNVFANVFGVSAKRGIDAVAKSAPDLRSRSGLPKLEEWIETNLLAQARELKEDAAKSKASEVLGEVRTERQRFDATVEESAAAVRVAREMAAKLVDDELRAAVTEQQPVLRARLEQSLDEAAVAIVSRTDEDGFAPITAFEPVHQMLRSASFDAWNVFLEAIFSTYREGSSRLKEALASVDRPEWKGVLDMSMREFELNVASWDKDLSDYIEQVIAYLDGFVEGRGMFVCHQLDVPNENKRDAESVAAALKKRMAFLWDRVESASNRWLRELRENFEDTLARLEREIRKEASSIREHSYRRIERLAGALGIELPFESPPSLRNDELKTQALP